MTTADPCIGDDPLCPCQDGLPCHYKDAADGTKAMPIPADCASAPAMQDALLRQVENIERWLRTGEPAGPDESRAIYEQMCVALGREPVADSA